MHTEQSLTWNDRAQAPSRAAVYAVYQKRECLYVGATINLHHRLTREHHKLSFLGKENEPSDIRFLSVTPALLRSCEAKWIRERQPKWNGRIPRDTITVNVILPSELHTLAKARAYLQEITLKQLIERAILSYLGNKGGAHRQKKTTRRKTTPGGTSQ